jgi:transketolase
MVLKNSVTGEAPPSLHHRRTERYREVDAGCDLVVLNAAGSGHAGGTLSIMDIIAALYLRVADHDPANPNWEDRDRIIWSTGHKAPSLYLSLAFAGFFRLTTWYCCASWDRLTRDIPIG